MRAYARMDLDHEDKAEICSYCAHSGTDINDTPPIKGIVDILVRAFGSDILRPDRIIHDLGLLDKNIDDLDDDCESRYD